jgi:hypothetical protein
VQSNARLIEEKNGLKYPSPGDAKSGWQKEWYHICIQAPGLDLLVNLNVSSDTRPSAPAGSRVARVVLMAHDGEWSGDIEPVDSRLVRVTPGEVAMCLGQNEIAFRDGKFELVAALQVYPLAVNVRLEPQCTPLGITHEVSVGHGAIGWFAIPRLSVTGHVVKGDRVYPLVDATAYHDHNWGHWLWGQDFSWEWGFGHLADGEESWTIMFDRTLNRARTRLLESTFALWRGEMLVKMFSRNEISVRPIGYQNPKKLFRIPRALAIAVPELGRDVPSQFEVTARSGPDHVSLVLTPRSEAQILIPNETDLETTIITEVLGTVQIAGEIRGRLFTAAGRGVFEFLAT